MTQTTYEQISFSTNHMGQLFLPMFPTVRLWDETKYQVGKVLEVVYGKQKTPIGLASIAAIKVAKVKSITDTLSMYLTGKPAYYMKGILQKMYPALTEDSNIVVVVLHYKQRYLAEQQRMLADWWQSQIEQTPGYDEFKAKAA